MLKQVKFNLPANKCQKLSKSTKNGKKMVKVTEMASKGNCLNE